MTRKWLSTSLVAGCLLLAGCQSTGAGPDEDDGYFTWVDEQGRVRQTVIPRESLEEAVSEPSKRLPRAAQESDTASAGRPRSSDTPGPESGDTEDSRYNLRNYPDGNELEKAGFIRPGDPMPYFTWLDASGNVRVSYYTPDTRSDVEKGLIRPPVRLTPASTYQPDSPSGTSSDAFEANPETLAILGVEREGLSWFQRWSNQCCEELSAVAPREWEQDREFPINIGQDAPRHEFSTGISAYRLVRLPPPSRYRDFVVRLRAYAENGQIFVPSAAFLDSRLRPVRVVTDLAHEFVPESWHRQAYLQAFIPVFPEQNEHWMLLFTRRQDLKGQTVVEDKRRPVVFRHGPSGLLSVKSVVVD